MKNFLKIWGFVIAYFCIAAGLVVWAFAREINVKYIYDPTTGACFAKLSNNMALTSIPCSDQVLEQAGALKPTARF